jgi:hypothetical protein
LFESRKLKFEKGIWRVDAFGGIELSAYGIPKIFISLSQIQDVGLNSPLVKGVQTGEQKWIKEPLNRISEYLIGSCWEHGKRISRLSAFENTFEVDTSKIQFVHAGDNIHLNGIDYPSAVPDRAIKLGKNLKGLSKKSIYAIVPVLNSNLTDFLVVPCVELYRFYIGVSSGFINKVLTNDISQYFCWEKPHLRVKTRLSRLEQFVAYRGHDTEEGKAWFQCSSDHIKRTAIEKRLVEDDDPESISTAELASNFSAGRAPFSLKSRFPFSDSTTLTVCGKRFRYFMDGKKDTWAVFAANIINCDHKESFSVKISSDRSLDEAQPWSPEIGDSDDFIDSPFDGESALPETDEGPNVFVGGVAVLNSSNRFTAMNDVDFIHTATGEVNDPVYGQGAEGESICYSYEDVVETDTNENTLHKKDFDSHVYEIDRLITDFVRLIPYMRVYNSAKGWEVASRGCESVLEQYGEIVTTFLPSRSRRHSWRTIEDNGSRRLRQIVWLEICIAPDRFIYLAEMELKKSELGRSTLGIIRNNFEYMSESDFKIFLEMTAVKNRWPKMSHGWRSEKARARSAQYFSEYSHVGFSHPEFISDTDLLSEEKLAKWAEVLSKSVLSEVNKYLAVI